MQKEKFQLLLFTISMLGFNPNKVACRLLAVCCLFGNKLGIVITSKGYAKREGQTGSCVVCCVWYFWLSLVKV